METFNGQAITKKKEKIIKCWNVPKQKGINLVFQSEDNTLWELCDVGFGWSKYEKPESDWKINSKIQEYLPAVLNPRPEMEIPWDYKFKLSKGAELWVKKEKEDQPESIEPQKEDEPIVEKRDSAPMDIDKAMKRVLGNTDLLETLVDQFTAAMPEQVKTLKAALEHGDNEAVQQQCLSFYEMGMEICFKMSELHSQLEAGPDKL